MSDKIGKRFVIEVGHRPRLETPQCHHTHTLTGPGDKIDKRICTKYRHDGTENIRCGIASGENVNEFLQVKRRDDFTRLDNYRGDDSNAQEPRVDESGLAVGAEHGPDPRRL